MNKKTAILISKTADMIYQQENMSEWTEEQFFSTNIHSIVAKYNIKTDIIDHVIADLTSYFDY